MTNYSNTGRSFIYGLSDFWNLYFKDVDTLNAYYDASEVLTGQSYLDLLGLMLNSSVQDTPLFNKEYFKLIRINETDLQYRQGLTPEANRYEFDLPDDIVSVSLLNSRILSPTAALDNDVDFYIDDINRRLQFKFDPTNAYAERTWGTGNGAIRIRSRLVGADGENIRVFLNDMGGALSITRSDFDITIAYDGPANTNTTTVLSIVAAVNVDSSINGIVLAEVAGLGTGTASVADNGGLQNLLRVDRNPLDNFALKRIQKAFSAQLTDSTVTDWISAGVQKGDKLRIIDSPNLGKPVELDIDLVRPATLYVSLDTPLDEASVGKVNYAVVRETDDNTSVNEPFPNSGSVLQAGIDGTITGPIRQFSSPTATFADAFVGDLISIVSPNNTGSYEIRDVINPFTVELIGPTLTTETPVQWQLTSVIDPVNLGIDGVFTNLGDGTATFTSVIALFPATALGNVLRIHRPSGTEHYNITTVVGANALILGGVPTAAVSDVGLSWGLASAITPTYSVIFSPPTAWPTASTVSIRARRLIDNKLVERDIDFETNEDTGRVRPITVWKASVNNLVTYSYKLGVFDNLTAIDTGADGTITPGSPNVFSSPTAAFTYYHTGYAIRISGSGLPGGPNNGIHYIAAVVNPTTVQLSNDRVLPTLPDPGNGALGWELLRRGTTSIDDVTEQVDEIALWAPNALVDRYHLYNTYGYLIGKFERSSEEYRSLIRGIFQLFMLGPTLERFESAINVVSGLPVVRNDDEILLSYADNALDSGADGFLDFASRTFTSATASFTYASVGQYVYIASGVNENKLFRINTYVAPTQVILETAPSTDGPVDWEHTAYGEQTVTTSAQSYTFARQIPLRQSIMDPANFGTLTLRAFEVLTDVFQVTDYVETPNWWERITIPEELMPGQSAFRRHASPELVENVLNPSDGGCVGDPGFIIGRDSEGLVVPPGTLPKRNKMAFVVLEKFLKHHMFFVQFDAALTDLISANTLQDLGELVFAAKPTYTYIVVTPSLVLREVINLSEDPVQISPVLGLVDDIAGNAAPLMVIGSCWRIGNWFRNIDNTDTFAAPAAGIADPLGPAAPGYIHYTRKFVPDIAAFQSGGVTIEPTKRVEMARDAGLGAEVSTVAGITTITLPNPVLSDLDVFNRITLAGAVNPGNNGTWIIGAVTSPTEAVVYIPAPVDEAGIVWFLYTSGGMLGRVYTNTTGQTFLEDLAGLSNFTSGSVGQWIRLTYSTSNALRSFQIVETISTQIVRIADLHQTDPCKDFADIAVDITGNTITATPGDFIFTKSMCSIDRHYSNPATRNALQYYAVVTGGANAGERRLLNLFVAVNSVTVAGAALINDPAAPIHIEVEKHYNVVEEITAYEVLEDQIVLSGASIDLSNTPVQDVDPAVAFDAYGVREPVDPTLGVFDASLGDTLYSIGMQNPRQDRGRSRTGLDVDLRDEPIQITVI